METKLPDSIEDAIKLGAGTQFTEHYVRLIAETAYCMGRMDGMTAMCAIDQKHAQKRGLAPIFTSTL